MFSTVNKFKIKIKQNEKKKNNHIKLSYAPTLSVSSPNITDRFSESRNKQGPRNCSSITARNSAWRRSISKIINLCSLSLCSETTTKQFLRLSNSDKKYNCVGRGQEKDYEFPSSRTKHNSSKTKFKENLHT